jgi:hypothetical protein
LGFLVSLCAESVVIMPAFGVQLEIHFWRYAVILI